MNKAEFIHNVEIYYGKYEKLVLKEVEKRIAVYNLIELDILWNLLIERYSNQYKNPPDVKVFKDIITIYNSPRISSRQLGYREKPCLLPEVIPAAEAERARNIIAEKLKELLSIKNLGKKAKKEKPIEVYKA